MVDPDGIFITITFQYKYLLILGLFHKHNLLNLDSDLDSLDLIDL